MIIITSVVAIFDFENGVYYYNNEFRRYFKSVLNFEETDNTEE